MITTEEISVKVYQMLSESEVKDIISGSIGYERADYSLEDIIIIPHTIDGESSVRYGQININIHVPDIVTSNKTEQHPKYVTNFQRLIDIRKKVIEVLKSHYEVGSGWNWIIGRLNPPIKEQNYNEHYVSLALEVTVREKK